MLDHEVVEARRPARWWTWLTAITALLVTLVCGVILYSFIPPTVSFPIFALAAWVLLILGAFWLTFALIGWFKYRAFRWTLVAPVLVLVTIGLVALSVPSTFAFTVSKRALSTAADQCGETFEDQTIGLYRVWMTERVDGGCLFYMDGGLIDPVGLAHMPDGVPYLGDPRHEGDIGYQEFNGDWYRFVVAF